MDSLTITKKQSLACVHFVYQASPREGGRGLQTRLSILRWDSYDLMGGSLVVCALFTRTDLIQIGIRVKALCKQGYTVRPVLIVRI